MSIRELLLTGGFRSNPGCNGFVRAPRCGNRKVPHKVVTTVTDVIREIDGVKAVLVYDHSVGAGQVVSNPSTISLKTGTAPSGLWVVQPNNTKQGALSRLMRRG